MTGPRDTSVWEASCLAIQSEWLRCRGVDRDETSIWEAAVQSMSSEEGVLRNAGQWMHGRDDLLGVIGRHRDELTHSRFVGWLLDPCARHGLGTRVLSTLLTQLFGDSCSVARLELARVRWEVPVAEGRLDIVVSAPGVYLVVENKVDAAEGETQCAYYEEHVLHPDRRFVLLTPDGRQPQSGEHFAPLSYKVFAAVLERALAETTADEGTPGRRIAAEYLRTLRREFL